MQITPSPGDPGLNVGTAKCGAGLRKFPWAPVSTEKMAQGRPPGRGALLRLHSTPEIQREKPTAPLPFQSSDSTLTGRDSPELSRERDTLDINLPDSPSPPHRGRDFLSARGLLPVLQVPPQLSLQRHGLISMN